MPRLNRQTAYEKAKEINFSTSSADVLAGWRISGIKGPVWEQWYFDSVSEDGKSSLVLTVARDASYAILGRGFLRVEIDVTFEDGQSYNHVEWMSEAVVEDREEFVHGAWISADHSVRFQIAGNGASARVELDTAAVRGRFDLAGLSPPVYPNGETQEELNGSGKTASTELLPKIHLVQVIPTGTVDTDLMVQDRLLRFKGIGGHMHAWAQGSWFDTTLGWRVMRGVAGPFSVTVMEYTDMDGLVHSSGYVVENGVKRFAGKEVYTTPKSSSAAQQALSYRSKEKGDHISVRWKPVYNTGFTGRFRDRSTGATLHFSSGTSDESYEFEITNHRKAFEFLFGSSDSGLTAFLGEIKGGKVGGEVHRGVQLCNLCVLPQGLTKVYFFICMLLAVLTFGYINILGTNT